MGIVILVPILGIVFGCGIALLAIWTEYKRDRALIEKGLYQPKKEEPAGPPGWGFLIAGCILAGMGIGLSVSAFAFRIGRAMGAPGFVFLFVGLGLLLVYFLASQKKRTPEG